MDARGIRWKQDDQSLNLPALRWQVESHADGPRRIVHNNLTVEKLSVGMSDRRLSFADVSSDTTATFTEKWEADEIELKQLLKVRSLERRPALPYPVQDLEGSFSARREPNGVIHVPDLKLSNAGTSTAAEGPGAGSTSATTGAAWRSGGSWSRTCPDSRGPAASRAAARSRSTSRWPRPTWWSSEPSPTCSSRT